MRALPAPPTFPRMRASCKLGPVQTPQGAESTLSYDGKDFTRTETTLMNNGQSAVGTKLDPAGPAYKALSEKRSYTGLATLFGHDYQAAPLLGADGKLTGAEFVGVPK